MNKEEIKIGILFLLSHSNENWLDEKFADNGFTFLEIMEFLKLNNVSIDYKELKILLDEMEDEGLFEERHFGKELMGRVDYDIETPGAKLLEKQDMSKLEKKWRLPEFVT